MLFSFPKIFNHIAKRRGFPSLAWIRIARDSFAGGGTGQVSRMPVKLAVLP